MSETILITIADVSEYRRIDPKFDINRFNGFAKEVQRNNLRDLLGMSLHYDLFLIPTATKYTELVSGKTYKDSSDNDVQFYGLKPAICYWWLAVMAREGDLFHSAYGAIELVNNPQQNFERAREKERVAVGYMETAQTYANDAIRFLNANKSTYPLWKCEEEENKTNFISFRV
jgi:hypothetical protein